MSLPARIQRLRTKGWRLPAGAVYVGRPTRWGNPVTIEQVDGVGWCITDTRTGLTADCPSPAAAHTAAVARYRAMLDTQPDLVEHIRRELRGKPLCCWCPPHLACHADILLLLANERSACDGGQNV
jgi:hypothetical protein